MKHRGRSHAKKLPPPPGEPMLESERVLQSHGRPFGRRDEDIGELKIICSRKISRSRKEEIIYISICKQGKRPSNSTCLRRKQAHQEGKWLMRTDLTFIPISGLDKIPHSLNHHASRREIQNPPTTLTQINKTLINPCHHVCSWSGWRAPAIALTVAGVVWQQPPIKLAPAFFHSSKYLTKSSSVAPVDGCQRNQS